MCDNQYLTVSHIIRNIYVIWRKFSEIFVSLDLSPLRIVGLVFLSPMKHLCIIDKKYGFSICELKWQRPESGK